MSRKVGRFSIAIACVSNAFGAIYKTLSAMREINNQTEEEELAKNQAMHYIANEMLRNGEAPTDMSEEALVNKLLSDMEKPLYTGSIPTLEESKISANEVLMASKAFVLLSVSDKGVMEVYRDFTQATGPELSALLVLSDKAADELTSVIYEGGEEVDDGEEDEGDSKKW